MNLSKLLPAKKLSKPATIVIFSALAIFLLIWKGPHSNNTTSPSAETVSVSEQKELGLPKYIKIPAINVNAPVESVGLTAEGDVDASKNPNNAGWYNLGPKPGEVGSSVIDGHFGWRDGLPAAFDNLANLQKGDKVYIEDEAGNSNTFVVRELKTYGPEEIVPSVFISEDNKAHLNLITCGGAWDKTQQSYAHRLVVFTDKE